MGLETQDEKALGVIKRSKIDDSFEFQRQRKGILSHQDSEVNTMNRRKAIVAPPSGREIKRQGSNMCVDASMAEDEKANPRRVSDSPPQCR